MFVKIGLLLKDFIGNGQIVRTKKDILIRIPLGLLFCILLGIFPLIVAFVGAWLTKVFTGQECLNEGNCFWAAMPWLCLMTLPAAFVLCIIILIKSFRETYKLLKTNRYKHEA